MLYYEGDDLARIVNKVLGKTAVFCVLLLQTVLVNVQSLVLSHINLTNLHVLVLRAWS